MAQTKVKYYQLELIDSITGNDLEPTFLGTLATKAYVDGIKQSLDIKDSVRVAVSTNVPLTPLSASFDGVTIITGQRILLMGQTNPAENGIYIFNGISNLLTRSLDANDAIKVTLGLYTYTEAGTNVGKAFVLYSTNTDPIVLDTTELLFTQFSGSSINDTDDLPEGSTNLYFTDVRAQAALAADLANKANTVHTHTTADITNLSSYTGFDSRYYTETEVDTLLGGKANSIHTHTTADITDLSSYTGFDSRYYTETEVDTLLSGKSDTSHTHTFASLTSKPTTLSGYGITDAYPLIGNPSGFLTTIAGITAGGELSGTYADPTLLNSAVIGKVLTGLNITGGTISATDTILAAFGKVQNQLNGLIGGTTYKGTWNASTNTPTLTSSVGTDGNYYIVSVAGTTNLDGITDWKIGDWAIFHGGVWQKVDNTDAVVTVNGFTGAVVLTTADISEVTNLYYTDARVNTFLGSYTGFDSRYYTESEIDTLLSGKANSSHTHAASDITSGVISTARLGSGTADSTTYLRGDSTWVTIPSATPGGSTTEIQYNNAGAFAGSANFVWDNTNSRLRLGGGTKVSDLSIISSAAFGDGNIYVESSDATVGASFTLNTTSVGGRKYSFLSRASSGRLAFYDYTAGLDVVSFDGSAYNSIAIQGNSTAGAGISMQSSSTGGGIWTLLSTANGNIIGGGKFGFYDGSAYRLILDTSGRMLLGGTTFSASATFQVDSITRGILIPRMTTTEQNAISSPATGLSLYNTTLNLNSTYNGTVWTQSWSTRGNATVSGDFIGTTNSQPLVFKVNNIRNGFIETVSSYQLHFGYAAGLNNSANYNTTYGHFALSQNVGTGGANSLFGSFAGEKISSGDGNNLFGFEAGKELTNASWNIAIGYQALRGASGSYNHNIAFGYQSQYSAAASGNISIGNSSLRIVTGNYNVAIGFGAGYAMTSGAFNVLSGYSSGNVLTTGNYNVGLGSDALVALTTGSNNIGIGYNQNVASNTGSNQMNIGGLIFGVGMTGSVGAPAGRVGILTNAPASGYALDVNGDIKAVRINVGTITSSGAATAAIGDSGSITGSTYSWIMGGFSNTINGGYICSISGGSANSVSGTNNNVAAAIGATIPSGTTNNTILGGGTNTIFAGTSSGNQIIGSMGSFVDSNKNNNRVFGVGVYATYNGGLYLSDYAASGGGYLSASADDQFVARFLNGYLFKTANNATRMILDSNGSLGLGTTSVVASSMFQIDSTTKGILIPRMTTTNRDAISSPATSLLIFNTSNNRYEFYNGSAWSAIGNSGTVTSVGIVGHPIFNIFNSPITTSGNIDLSIYDQSANTFFAGPSATSGQPTFRAITYEDLPNKPIVDKTANYTVTTSDYTINCTSGTFDVTLLPAILGLKGQIYVIKNSGAGVIDVVPDGTDTIDGTNSSFVLNSLEVLKVQCTGSSWIIIN